MFLSPLIERELHVALRKRDPIHSRFWAGVIAAGVTVLFMFLAMLDRTFWQFLHGLLFLVGLGFGVIRPAQFCLGLFTEERSSQNLELLFLTGMNSAELFVGKLIGGLLVASYDLLALMPFLALPFLAGGVSYEMFLAAATCLPALLLFSVSAATLASVCCEDDGQAALLFGTIIGLICGTTPVLYRLGLTLTGLPPFSSPWLWLSPAYGALVAGRSYASGGASDFWPTLAMTVGWSVLLFGLAAIILQRTWRGEFSGGGRRRGGHWKDFVRGSQSWRAALRLRVLDENPFRWLAERDRRAILSAWLGVLILGLLWLAGFRAWPDKWLSAIMLYSTAILVLMLVSWFEIFAAGRILAESRRDGRLELLLTTPLDPEVIVAGQFASLKAQFDPMRKTILGLFVAMALGGYLARSMNIQATIAYFLIWGGLVWFSFGYREKPLVTAMWVGVITGQPAYRLTHSKSWWVFLCNGYNIWRLVSNIGPGTVSFPSGSLAETFLVILVTIFVIAVVMVDAINPSIRNQLIRDFRSLAQTPVPARNDPRFKQWKKLTDPFPTIRTMRLQPESFASRMGRRWRKLAASRIESNKRK